MDFCCIDSAEEEVFDGQDGVAGVEEDAAEDFAVAVGAVGSEEGAGTGGFAELALTFQLAAEDAFGSFEDLFVSVALGQLHVVCFHGVVSRGGIASWSRPSAPSARFAPMSEHACARSGGRNESREKLAW